jgi:hypothetical protein
LSKGTIMNVYLSWTRVMHGFHSKQKLSEVLSEVYKFIFSNIRLLIFDYLPVK